MSRDDRTINRDPEKPPRGSGGAGSPTELTLVERLVARIAHIDVHSAERADRPRRESTIPQEPEKPAPEESGAWNKRGFRSVDRVVNWIVTGDPDMP